MNVINQFAHIRKRAQLTIQSCKTIPRSLAQDSMSYMVDRTVERLSFDGLLQQSFLAFSDNMYRVRPRRMSSRFYLCAVNHTQSLSLYTSAAIKTCECILVAEVELFYDIINYKLSSSLQLISISIYTYIIHLLALYDC